MEDLWRVVRSIREASAEAGVQVITGDTKVVDKGKGDGVFINTSGIGSVLPGLDVGPHRLRPGDEIVISGPIGLHGIAIMALREGIELETELRSDSAPVYPMVEALAAAGLEIHMLRDPTRGGVSSALNEMAKRAGVGMLLDEQALPIPIEVGGVCEILGLDPLYVANEGNFLAVVAQRQGEHAVETLRQDRLGARAALIGRVTAEHPGVVVMRTKIGGQRVVDMMSGEQLPRIC
jgi:hydrogenase expression/formation protein HypE